MAINIAKRVSILASAIALSSFLSTAAFASTKPTNTTTTKPTKTAAVQNQSSNIVEQLNLTDQQRNKIRGIRSSRTRQINQVLKPDQRTKLQAELKSGKKLGEAIKSLNLDPTQKKDILAIVQKSNQDIMGTLNDKQRKQLETYLSQRHQSRTQNPID